MQAPTCYTEMRKTRTELGYWRVTILAVGVNSNKKPMRGGSFNVLYVWVASGMTEIVQLHFFLLDDNYTKIMYWVLHNFTVYEISPIKPTKLPSVPCLAASRKDVDASCWAGGQPAAAAATADCSCTRLLGSTLRWKTGIGLRSEIHVEDAARSEKCHNTPWCCCYTVKKVSDFSCP